MLYSLLQITNRVMVSSIWRICNLPELRRSFLEVRSKNHVLCCIRGCEPRIVLWSFQLGHLTEAQD